MAQKSEQVDMPLHLCKSHASMVLQTLSFCVRRLPKYHPKIVASSRHCTHSAAWWVVVDARRDSIELIRGLSSPPTHTACFVSDPIDKQRCLPTSPTVRPVPSNWRRHAAEILDLRSEQVAQMSLIFYYSPIVLCEYSVLHVTKYLLQNVYSAIWSQNLVDNFFSINFTVVNFLPVFFCCVIKKQRCKFYWNIYYVYVNQYCW